MRGLVSLLLVSLSCSTACIDKKKNEEKKTEELPATGALTEQQCEALLIDAEKQLSQVRAEMSKACEVDAECAVTVTGACIPSCPDYPMTKSSSFAYAQRRDQIDAVACKRWRDGTCDKITPKPQPACTAMKGVCQNKVCVAVTK